MFISSRYLFPVLPQQCVYCHVCKLDLQTRTKELLCPLRWVATTHISTIHEHYSCTEGLYVKQLSQLQAAQAKLYTSTAVPGCTTNQNGGLVWHLHGLTGKFGICITILMHMNE